ncbi:MAG: cation-transporting P-type ATPase, partial [Klebsiella pneumoniae]|nr:cation-transporting P-type ATPase [Klebsiella pneumoniae]
MTVQIKNRNKKSTLSMRAAQEAQNGIAETLVNLKTTREGLQEAQANARLERDGLNEVTHDKPPHALIQLLMAFNNPFIYVLAILAGISFFTDYWLPTSHGEDGDLTTVIIIGTMVALSGLVRFWQEHRSAKSAEALKAMVRTTATVVRREHDGQKGTPREIPMRELVVGDIVQLY